MRARASTVRARFGRSEFPHQPGRGRAQLQMADLARTQRDLRPPSIAAMFRRRRSSQWFAAVGRLRFEVLAYDNVDGGENFPLIRFSPECRDVWSLRL